MNIKEEIKNLKSKFPQLEKVNIQYRGSGDSFEEFWDINTVPENIHVEEEDIQDLLWYAIDNSEADFNNEGSEGVIEIDLKKKTLSIDNYYIVYDTKASGIKVFK